MIEKIHNGEVLYCIRPQYSFPKFDVSLQREAFKDIGQIVYGENKTVYVEDTGVQWFAKELLGKPLLGYFVNNLTRYYDVVHQRAFDYREIHRLMRYVEQHKHNNGQKYLRQKLDYLCQSYILALKYVIIANLVVEEAYRSFEELLRLAITKREVNSYIASLIRCPAAKRAAELNFYEDRRGTKKIQDVSSSPILIFASNELFTSNPLDSMVANKILENNVCPLSYFMALRQITPLTLQFAEDFRYADYSIRTHLKSLLHEISDSLKVNNVYDYGYSEVLTWFPKEQYPEFGKRIKEV